MRIDTLYSRTRVRLADSRAGFSEARWLNPALGTLLSVIIVGGAEAHDPAKTLGPWELSLQGSHRRCRITLADDETSNGRILRFPAGCRRALPILNAVGGWSLDGDTLRLLQSEARPFLDFGPRAGEEGLLAVSEIGEHYLLEMGERREIAVVEQASLPSAPVPQPPIEAPGPPPIGVPQVTTVDPAKAPRPETVPGVYAVDRYFEREVCRVELRQAPFAGAARPVVRLRAGCRDPGLAAFDPVAWRYEDGRLTLTARRGHEVTLISDKEGRWRRDPEIGATLVLRRTQP